MVTIHHRGESKTVEDSALDATLSEMIARLGAWVPGETKVQQYPAGWMYRASTGAETVRENSTFSHLVKDDQAKERIESMHDAINASGVVRHDASQQYFKTGTRMADEGYGTQHARKRKHDQARDLRDAVGEKVAAVEAEKRQDRIITAREFGALVTLNGKLQFDGLRIQEQALRGLLGRLGSPALGYVLGLRERLGDKDATPVAKNMDRDALVDVIQRECKRHGDRELKIRTRPGCGDVFACMSPEYGVADLPQVAPLVLDAFPSGSKGHVTYDPDTTAWEVKATIWTPTPVEEQAVGEPFSGFGSVRSRDNGTGRLWPSGGIEFLICLNASKLAATIEGMTGRVHRKNIMVDLGRVFTKASEAMRVLAGAWGKAGQEIVPAPVDKAGDLIPLEVVIPGFFRHMLTKRKGVLVGVLPGKTEEHVKALAVEYGEQRREANLLVRGDFGQAFTSYLNSQPLAVANEAEAAIAEWIVAGETMEYAAA